MTVAAAQSAPCDVLIVEDDVQLSDVIASYFTRRGLSVRTAHSGSAAVRLLDRIEPPRVAILDYHLPGESGLELAKTIHGRLPEMSIVLMSGGVGGIDQTTLEKSGIRIFVNKPVPLAALYRAVMQLMGRGT